MMLTRSPAENAVAPIRHIISQHLLLQRVVLEVSLFCLALSPEGSAMTSQPQSNLPNLMFLGVRHNTRLHYFVAQLHIR